MPYQKSGKLQQTNITLPRETGEKWRALRNRLGLSNHQMAERLLRVGEKRLLQQRRKELEGSP